MCSACSQLCSLDGYVIHTHIHTDSHWGRSGFCCCRIRMENPQRSSPLIRDMTRAFSHYNKHNILLKKNLKETIVFFREIRQNHSNTCTAGPLEIGEFVFLMLCVVFCWRVCCFILICVCLCFHQDRCCVCVMCVTGVVLCSIAGVVFCVL